MSRLIALMGAFFYFFPLFNGYSQTSSTDGDWATPETWDCGCTPDFTSGTITIDHDVSISTQIEADEVIVNVNGTLTINNGGKLILHEGDGDDLTASGQVIINDGGILESSGQIATTASTMIFEHGSEYQHNQNGGAIVTATWQSGSTCRITGWVGTVTPDAIFLTSLSQTFHHFIWDAPGQSAANVFLRGSLQTVNGDLTIKNTNSQSTSNRRITLGFNGPASGGISIGGRLIVTGTSKLTFSSSGDYTVTVGGNVEFSSTANDGTGNQYQLTSTGNTNLNIEGNLIVNSGQFNLSAGSSTGIGSAIIKRNFELNGGSIHKTGLGTGNIFFSGDTFHDLIVGSGTFTANQAINYTVDADDTLDLGLNAIGDSVGGSGTFTNNGTVILGSPEPTGAISGNLFTDPNVFTAGSTIIYGGVTPQFIGANHPTSPGVNTVIDNASGVSLGAETLVGGNLAVKSGSSLNLTSNLSVSGNINFEAGSIIDPNENILTLTGGIAQAFFGGGATLHNLVVNKTGGTDVTLTNSLGLTGQVSVSSPNSALISNGFLRLISTSDSSVGNAHIAPLLDGATVDGDVIVERFMSEEGRIYRYISSSVMNATIEGLQDDFPVTGSFPEASTCSGCTSNPSLFFYDAVTAQYTAYPLATNSEQIAPGRGYAAFIRQDLLPAPVVLDLQGPINQGTIELPVFHNGNVAESWNLVGNPYPSSVDWDAPAWTKTNIYGSIAVRDNGVGMGAGFRYWNGSVGSGVDGGLADGEIATGQGFWVQTLSAVPTPVLSISEQAKISNSGTFYRSREVDALSIILSKGDVNDMTVLQIHDGATQGIDFYDASKMSNDNFDFSTKFENSPRFAINATNEINCDEELFLDLRFTKASNGSFVLNPRGNYLMEFQIRGSKFSRFDITLVDNFLYSQAFITPGYTHSFEITDNPASMATNRFKLIFQAKSSSQINFATGGLPLVCGDKEISLVIHDSEPGSDYYLVKDTNVISHQQTGNGGDLNFTVSGTLLSTGNNVINIRVKNVCNDVLTTSLEVLKEEVTSPNTVSGKQCREGHVELSITNDNPNSTYYWYEELTSDTPIFTGDGFITPYLFKSKTYFVSTVHYAGCESERKEITAQIVQYENAEITIVGIDTLRSNFQTENQWFYNFQKIEGADLQHLRVDKSGIYTLEVTTQGCKTEAELQYNITSIKENITPLFKAFPNPASKEFFIPFSDSAQGIEQALLVNNMGHKVGAISIIDAAEGKTGYANIEHLANGIYFIQLIGRNKIITMKLIKQ